MKLSLVALASAAAGVAGALEKRQVGGVLICNGANATGPCKYDVYALDACQQLSPPYHQNTSTFAPDGDDFSCFPRTYDCGAICTSPTGCTFGAVDFSYEHKYDLRAIQWDTLIRSFDCHKKTQ
ncbi:hypothetical protein AAL_04189 [Moelleriella libera RCEF 2490]|uniref:SSCRP protein n=1 Tax=Moelleriella libera RCEF 2490 TaxID=1081109 RepID=A0A162IN90_9HYPO|nr:hypothetical protein AAL_04189 [Moelleriella libera RCEF 2490]